MKTKAKAAAKRPREDELLPARRRGELTPPKVVRMLRELQGMSQNQLAEASGIEQPMISGIEHGRVSLGPERARKLARALRVHPAVILFPDWEEEDPCEADSASHDRPMSRIAAKTSRLAATKRARRTKVA
jgi:transcriptional regulator with XRE-family HTH domain